MGKQNPYITFIQKQNRTPQSEALPGQVTNSAGGHSFELDKWGRLNRFLILGSEGGSYYATERALTKENATTLVACINADGVRTVRTIVDVSESGRAPKNTPAIFALALTTTAPDIEARRLAMEAIPKVCRTGTHLFQFATMVNEMRGWGRALRRGMAEWYTEQDVSRIAYQMVKYRQRDGWTHRDVMRLAHPKPKTETQDALFQWATQDDKPAWATADTMPEDEALRKVWAFEQAQRAEDVKTIVQLIVDHNLVREVIPTQFLNTVEVWDALLQKMPMTAMIRNLGNMSKNGLLVPMSDAEKLVTERLTDMERLERARVHPIAVLAATLTYGAGRGLRGSGTWKPVPKVMDALNTAFELAFGVIQPANKRTMLALDVSGSMGWGNIAGLPNVSPRMAAAAMA
ncbi:MAG: TROVE domain-containing protein, partial [Chloroflexota bacterium]